MKLFAMLADANGRSRQTYLDIALHPVSDTERLSAKQDGTKWRIGFRQISDQARTSAQYASFGGPNEMHVGGPPHFVGVMAGHTEITTQDGAAYRLSPGEFHYVGPDALHHSNILSNVPVIIFNLGLPGTPEDSQPYVFK